MFINRTKGIIQVPTPFYDEGDNNGSDPNDEVKQVEIDGTVYNLDTEGNAVNPQDNTVFKTKAELDAEFEVDGDEPKEVEIDGVKYALDSEGNAVNEKGEIVKPKAELEPTAKSSIELVKQHIQLNPVDENGNPINYDDSPEGIARFTQDAANILARKLYSDAFANFMQANSDIADVIRYKQLHGTIEGYVPGVDHSTIEITDKSTEEQLTSIIMAGRIAKGDSPETAKRYIAFRKNDNSLIDAAKEEQQYLSDAKSKQQKVIDERNAEQQRQYTARQNEYYNTVKTKVDTGKLNVEGREIIIPAAIEVKANGVTNTYTRADFYRYITEPIPYKDENGNTRQLTRNQIDKLQSLSKTTIDDEILEAYSRFTKKGASFTQTIIDSQKVADIKRYKTKSAAHNNSQVQTGSKSTDISNIVFDVK